mgnify:CR=1 FL=1
MQHSIRVADGRASRDILLGRLFAQHGPMERTEVWIRRAVGLHEPVLKDGIGDGFDPATLDGSGPETGG